MKLQAVNNVKGIITKGALYTVQLNEKSGYLQFIFFSDGGAWQSLALSNFAPLDGGE